MKIEKDIYLTRDLYEASFLYISDLKFLGLDGNGNSTTFYFRFQGREKAEVLSNRFWSKTTEGNIKEYSDAVCTLKHLIFSKRRRLEYG